MKKPPPLGLLASGPVSRYGVARLTSIRTRLGPVKAPSYRVARRMVNSWKAGRAARTMEELKDCLTLVIDVPAEELPTLVAEMASQPWEWNKRTVLLWSAEQDSTALEEIAKLGGETATFNLVPGFEKRVTTEGSRPAVRAVKRLLAGDGWYVMPLEEGKKPLYQAGLDFSETLPLTLLHAAVESLIAAGLSYVEAVDTSTAQLQRAARAYVSTGRRAWRGPAAPSPTVIQTLAEDRPCLADFYQATLRHGNRIFERDCPPENADR